MKTMKEKPIIIIVSIILMVSNLPVISTTIMEKIDDNRFRYSNADASFAYVQGFDLFRGWISESTIWRFIETQRPEMRNMEVYRLYEINPLCFWRWRYYYNVSRKFKYRSWDDIEPNRVPRIPDNMWQQF